MTSSEAINFIHSVSNYFCKPGLARIEKLCAALGNPQEKLRFVHVAGTNGKGSFCAFLSEILMSAGYTVGRYTSPFILEFNERIAVNNTPITDSSLASITSKVKAICDAMEDKPTEFEVITAIGFVYFVEMGCDIVVLECGLGGRLDATNIIKSHELSVITGIDFDHQNFLGNTIKEIALEKAGIIKANRPVLWCGNNAEAESVILSEAKCQNAPLYKVDKSKITVNSLSLSGTLFDFGSYRSLKINMLGTYQPENAAAAVMAAELLCENGWKITTKDIEKGLGLARWPARFELISTNPTVIFDGGHNPQGVTAAVNSIKAYFGDKKVNFLSGVMADKDYGFIAKKISEAANKVFCITAPNPRALNAADYAEEFSSLGISATAYPTIPSAVTCAINESRATGVPLVCIGSLYMYGDIYKIING